MDDRYRHQPVARWYIPTAAASLLFMLLLCAGYIAHVATDPATLPLDRLVMHEATPVWLPALLGVGGIVGAVGGLMLLLRRRGAVPLLLISLLCALLWFCGLFAVPQLRDLLSTNDIVMGLVIVALSWTIYWFARHSRQRGWLH
jgi:hypothetical protein